VKRRGKSALGDRALKQIEHVRVAAGEAPEFGVLRFVDADWGFHPETFGVKRLRVVWQRELGSQCQLSIQPVVDSAWIAICIAAVFRRAQ